MASRPERISDIVSIECVEVEDLVKAYPVALLNRQRMICRLKLQRGAQTAAPWLYGAFKLLRVGVTFQLVGEPTEPRSKRNLVLVVVMFQVGIEIVLREGGPCSDFESHALRANYWQFQDTPNEEGLLINNAKIRGQNFLGGSNLVDRLVVSGSAPIIGCMRSKCYQPGVLLAATRA